MGFKQASIYIRHIVLITCELSKVAQVCDVDIVSFPKLCNINNRLIATVAYLHQLGPPRWKLAAKWCDILAHILLSIC